MIPVAMAGGPSVGRFLEIAVKIIVSQNRTTHRCDPHGLAPDPQLVDGFGHQAVDDSVGASRAVMGRLIGQRFGVW